MKFRIGIIYLITILAILGGGILNLREFINDYWPVNIKNVIVTAMYTVIWIIVLIISMKYKYFSVVKVYSVFWIITLINSILIILNGSTGSNIGWAILPGILFLCPWYGLTFYIKDDITIGMIIAVFSILVLGINELFIRSNSRYKNKTI